MSHFALVIDGIVENVIVAEQEFIDSLPDAQSWVQTSYNTNGGYHPERRPLRKNFAGIGYAYDAQRDAFIPPKPFDSWVLNEATCLWEPPVVYPPDGKRYIWVEATRTWEPVPLIET